MSHQDILTKFLSIVRYIEALEASESSFFSVEDLAKRWNLDIDTTKKIIRKLRREGFIRRTRGGNYKLTLAAKVLIRVYKRARERQA
ncbi:MAG: Rrf2 family transcriptional regulator [Ignisphaera sp.]|nr:Rrf2 family transcriptional regulator [Ignisphaera sp.]